MTEPSCRGLWSTCTFTNSYFFIGQLVLFCNSYFGQHVLFLWSTRTFSLVNSYFLKNYLLYALLLYYGTSCALNRLIHFQVYFLKELLITFFLSIVTESIKFRSSSHYHLIKITEPLYDKTNENNYAPIKDLDQTGRIRVLAVHSMGSNK